MWNYITRKLTPLEDWVRLNYPPSFMRRRLLNFFLRRTHETGIAKHYDLSNEFYERFLDNKATKGPTFR